jgi:hypothetical protein
MNKLFPIIDENNYYIGTDIGYDTSIQPGVILAPLGSIDAEIPEVPEGYKAKWVDNDWVFEQVPAPQPEPEPPLSDLKDNLWNLVKTIRSHYEYGGVLVSEHWFHTDTESRIKHTNMDMDAKAAIGSGALPTDNFKIAGYDIPWTTMANTSVILTNELVMSVATAIKILDLQIYPHSQSLRTQINNAESKEDLEQINIWTGWPNTFNPPEQIPYW